MSLRHTLLALLDWFPLHGYALREYAKGYAWLHPMTNANIYPTLRSLEGEGFVEHREEVHEGRLRKVYHATDDGREELRRWLTDPGDQRGLFRDPALLRICLLREGVLEDARPWIERERDRTAETVQQGQDAIDGLSGRIPKYTRMVAEHGVALARLRLEWLGELLAEIDRDVAAEAGSASQSA